MSIKEYELQKNRIDRIPGGTPCDARKRARMGGTDQIGNRRRVVLVREP